MTIAYSNKYDLWTTRYSFEPTCYARTGNTMLSSKENGLWKHDVNENRCRFYDVNGGASINVFSNQDPSAIKSFNSLSIETNINSWTASVYTNEEYTTGERQEGQVNSFDSREGFKYAEMPRSVINSTGNISPLPKLYWDYYVQLENELLGIEAEIIHPFSHLGEYILINLIAENEFPVVIGSKVKMLDENGNFAELNWNEAVIGSLLVGSEPPFFDTQGGTYIYSTGFNNAGFFRVTLAVKKNEDAVFETTEGPADELSTSLEFHNLAVLIVVTSAQGDAQTPTGTESGYGPQFGFNPFLIESLGVFAPALLLSPFGYQSSNADAGISYNYNSSFSLSPSVLNGDQMRGPYARIELETQAVVPLELHAINVDYSFSNLDSRLNQNT